MNKEISISKPEDVARLRRAFRIQYNRFAKDFNEISERFRKITEDADLLLGAMEEIMRI